MDAAAIGYGRGLIEPRIAPLVDAIRFAGFETFSSCEGHIDDNDRRLNPFASIAFYASEQQALEVHNKLRELSDKLKCSWVLQAGFVLHRRTNKWTLGWTIENFGLIEPGDAATYVERTVQAGWDIDIPLLAEMFSAPARPA